LLSGTGQQISSSVTSASSGSSQNVLDLLSSNPMPSVDIVTSMMPSLDLGTSYCHVPYRVVVPATAIGA